MSSAHPVRAAIAAAAVPAIAIASLGNQWFTEEVRREVDGNLELRLVNTVAGPFVWRVTPLDGRNSDTIWAAQLVAIVAVVGLTFLAAWLVAKSASGFGLVVGVLGATVLASMVGVFLYLVLAYGALFGGRDLEPGINRFWYSVFHSTDSALWGAGVGLIAGLAALLFAGGRDRVAPAPTAQTEPWTPADPPPTTAWDAPPPPPPAQDPPA